MNTSSLPPAGEVPVMVLTAISSAAQVGDCLIVDDKAYEGACLMSQLWPGRVRCVFRSAPPSAVLFGRARHMRALPFDACVIAADAAVPVEHIATAAVVVASGDNPLDLSLGALCKELDVPLIYVVENILRTRLQIVALESSPWPRKLKSFVWNVLTEIRRRHAFSNASALACNGTPAIAAYEGVTRDTMRFFDTRMAKEMFASDAELAGKASRIRVRAPLQLAFSGRLEPLKGADHLVLVARELAVRGQNFHLHVFGTGSLQNQMSQMIAEWNLSRQVTLHGSVDFRTQLVPFMRQHADAFLCCHRQSDPSCTYMEAMGCGLPVIGYRNKALSGILELANAGIAVPEGPRVLADAVVDLTRDGERLIRMARSARDLSAANDFVSSMERRVQQCLRWTRSKGPAERMLTS